MARRRMLFGQPSGFSGNPAGACSVPPPVGPETDGGIPPSSRRPPVRSVRRHTRYRWWSIVLALSESLSSACRTRNVSFQDFQPIIKVNAGRELRVDE